MGTSSLGFWIVGLGMAGLVAVAVAEEPHAHAGSSLELSPPLRAGLIEEMRAIDASLRKIVSAVPRADWAAIESGAREIAGAFVLERELTEDQRRELHHALPSGFLELDRRFHGTAERLGRAARERDPELVTFYVQRMMDGCVGCHSRHAPAAFPGFGPPAPESAHP